MHLRRIASHAVSTGRCEGLYTSERKSSAGSVQKSASTSQSQGHSMNVSTTFEHDTVHRFRRRSKTRDWLRRHRWFALFVVLPTLLAAYYYALVASPLYVSQSTFVIKSP